MGVVSQFVPVVGTYIAAALPLLVAVLVSPVDALIVLIYVLAYQQVENYLLAPKISAHTMQLHPAVAAQAIVGMWARVVTWWAESPGRAPRAAVLQTLVDLQLSGIRGGPP
jgi:hypothetical protein